MLEDDIHLEVSDYLELSVFAVDACNLRSGPGARASDCTSFLTGLHHRHGIGITGGILAECFLFLSLVLR